MNTSPTDLSVSDNLFQSEAWLKVVEESYGLKSHTIVTEDGFDFHFFEVPTFSGKRLVMTPFCDYTALHTQNKEQLMGVFLKISSEYPEAEITLKSRGPEIEMPVNLKVNRKAVLHTIPLAKELKFSSSFKRGVKKAEKAGLKVQSRFDLQGLQSFYQLYTKLRKEKFKSIPQPYTFFEKIREHFFEDEMGKVIEVSQGDKPIASAIVLAYGGRWYYKFGASDNEALKSRPNNLLFKKMIEEARAAGASNLDLGLSGTSDSYKGLRRFKSSMGGVESPLTVWRYQPPGFSKGTQNRFTSEVTKALVDGSAEGSLLEEMSKNLYPYFG